jgi:hypothetical protein
VQSLDLDLIPAIRHPHLQTIVHQLAKKGPDKTKNGGQSGDSCPTEARSKFGGGHGTNQPFT